MVDLGFTTLLAALELDLAAQDLHRGFEVDHPSHRRILTQHGGATQRRGRDRLGSGDGEPGADSGALIDAGRPAQLAGESRQHLKEMVGHLGHQVGLLSDDRDLLAHFTGIVSADLGSEAVLEWGDDATRFV